MKRQKKNRLFTKRVILPATVIILAFGVFFLFKAIEQRHRQQRVLIPATVSQSTKTPSSDKQMAATPTPTPGSSPTPSPARSSGKSAGGGTSNNNTEGTPLIKPSGSFVSNHRPNLSGSPAPSKEQSVCNTSPGASCTITFTKGSSVKTLAAQTADSNGAAYWSWDVNDAGFTTGTWQTTVTATLNGQSLSTQDSLTLEVAP